MTHSVTKSMLSSVVGVAYDRGMIKSLDDPVKDYVGPVQLYDPLPAANKSDRIGSSQPPDRGTTGHSCEPVGDSPPSARQSG